MRGLGVRTVAIYTAEKATELGAQVITLSDSGRTIHDPDGTDVEKLAFVRDLKERRRGRISEYAERYRCAYLDGQRPWTAPGDLAFPCATQNELNEANATALITNGCDGVVEGANMPTTLAAVHLLRDRGPLFGPAIAANAGGVAVPGLEQSQNSLRISWSRDEVDQKSEGIMRGIHQQCTEWGTNGDGQVDYVRGANLAGFKRLADAMLAYGTV